jgi:hypothetical protein
VKRARALVLDLQEGDLEAGNAVDSERFLGRFDAAGLRAEVDGSGMLSRLTALGYGEPVIRSLRQGSEHRLLIHAAADGQVLHSLVELRLTEATAVLEEPLLQQPGLGVLSLLCVHWLSLQHPAGAFTPERPRLPGQRHPGLGLGKRLYERVHGWAQRWGKDALLNSPEYFHNAVFYAGLFRFLAVRDQGRFEALRRDLRGLHVADASRALVEGRVIEEPAGIPFVWEPGEMVAPITPALRAAMETPRYLEAIAHERASVSFRVVGATAASPVFLPASGDSGG